jgi:protein required for attachment to host cells
LEIVMPKPQRTWIMVADAAQGRIFMKEGRESQLAPVADANFANPAAHGFSRDLGSDRPGRTVESVGGAHHAQEPKHDPHRAAKATFAKQIAEFVERSALENKFDKLVLVAPPQMLGDLRHALGRHATAKVASEVAKDLTKIPIHEIESHLPA